MVRSICIRCAGPKELPLSRCPVCEHVPAPDEAVASVLASTRMLSESELAEVQKRISKGESLRPSSERQHAARAILEGLTTAPKRSLTAAERGALVGISMLLTPLCAVAVAWAYRESPAGRQAAIIAAATLAFDLIVGAGAIFT